MEEKYCIMCLNPYDFYLVGEGKRKALVTNINPEKLPKIMWIYMVENNKSFNEIPQNLQDNYKLYYGKISMCVVRGAIVQVECNITNHSPTERTVEYLVIGDNIDIKEFSDKICMSHYDFDKIMRKTNGYVFEIYAKEVNEPNRRFMRKIGLSKKQLNQGGIYVI